MTRPSRPGATSACMSHQTILLAIFSHYLDRPIVLPHNNQTDPRYSFMLVCKTWKTIIISTPNYWKHLIFNPVRLRSVQHQLSIYHSYIQRSQQAPLSLLFATEIAPADVINEPIRTFMPKRTQTGHSVLELLYGHGEINVVESLIIPYAGRIRELHCIIANHATYRSLMDIGPGAFSILRSLGMAFISTVSSSERRFEAFADLPMLSIARLQILNDSIHPLDLRIPWHQLTKLDFLDTVIPARTLLRILHRCSPSLHEGYFTADFDALTKMHRRPFSLHMKTLIRFRLRILHGEYDDHFERTFTFPALKYIWIEKVVGPVMHRWDIEHYTSFLSPSSATLIQLTFSNLHIPAIHPDRKTPGLRTSYHHLTELLKALPNLEVLRLPSAIHIHPPTLEGIATGELLPRLNTFELSTLLPEVVFSMLQRRNGVEAGPSDQRLRYSSISRVQMNLPEYPLTKQEEITKYGNQCDLGMLRDNENGFILKFTARCWCCRCFGI